MSSLLLGTPSFPNKLSSIVWGPHSKDPKTKDDVTFSYIYTDLNGGEDTLQDLKHLILLMIFWFPSSPKKKFKYLVPFSLRRKKIERIKICKMIQKV